MAKSRYESFMENVRFKDDKKSGRYPWHQEREREIVIETVDKINSRFVEYFGTYTDKDEVKISQVFELLNKISEELKENVDD